MANWATLKAAINNVIKTNNNQAITGQVLQNVLNNVVSSIGENYQFVGIAIQATNPGTPDGNVFYIAYTAGTYANFGGIVVNSNEVAFLLYKGSWSKKVIGLATTEELDKLASDITNTNLSTDVKLEELSASFSQEIASQSNALKEELSLKDNSLESRLESVEKSKQDKLTAGNNIIIDSETKIISTGLTVLQGEGTSKENPMSQDAVTKELAKRDSLIIAQKTEVEAAASSALEKISAKEQTAIENFNAQRVTPEMLSESTRQLINSSGGGTITNLADDEDIESVELDGMKVMKFKDRKYTPSGYMGMGYKILRKGIPVTQQITGSDTVYVVRYDFDVSESGETGYIEFNDPEVARICVENFSSDGIGVTYEDAAKVTNLNRLFDGNKEIETFYELRYFTGLTALGAYQFSGMGTGFKAIALPKTLISISNYVFRNNTTEFSVLLYAETPPKLEWASLNGAGSAKFYVPDDNVNAYKSAEYWSNVSSRIFPMSEYEDIASLEGRKTLNMPKNCVLSFEGGSFFNGVVKGENTFIRAGMHKIFGEGLEIEGTFKNKSGHPEWFGAESTYKTGTYASGDTMSLAPEVDSLPDAAEAINRTIRSFCVTELVGGRIYRIESTIIVSSEKTLDIPPNTTIAAYMHGDGLTIKTVDKSTSKFTEDITREEPAETLAENQFIASESMAVAVQISSRSTIQGGGTIFLGKSTFTIGILVKGWAYSYLDMTFAPHAQVRIVGGAKAACYAPDVRDIIGSTAPDAATGDNGQYYYDKEANAYYHKENGAWVKQSPEYNPGNQFNVSLRFDVPNGTRIINPYIELWDMFGFRGIEIITYGDGWFNESIIKGTISNKHGSFVSIFAGGGGVSIHHWENITMQVSKDMQNDCRIFFASKCNAIDFGMVWDLAWFSPPRVEKAFELCANAGNVDLSSSVDTINYVEDNGENNIYARHPVFTKDSAIVPMMFENALDCMSTVYKGGFMSNNNDFCAKVTEIKTLEALINTDYSELKGTTHPSKYLFDGDNTTYARAIDTNAGQYGYVFPLNDENSKSQIKAVWQQAWIEIDYRPSTNMENNKCFVAAAGYNTTTIIHPLKAYRRIGTWSNDMTYKVFLHITGGPNRVKPVLYFYATEHIADVTVDIVSVKLWVDGNNINLNRRRKAGSVEDRPDALPHGATYYNEDNSTMEVNVGDAETPVWVDISPDFKVIVSESASPVIRLNKSEIYKCGVVNSVTVIPKKKEEGMFGLVEFTTNDSGTTEIIYANSMKHELKELKASTAYCIQVLGSAATVSELATATAPVGAITFDDPYCEYICAKKWGSGGFITYEQAATVETLTALGGESIESFDELGHFTSVVAIPNMYFQNYSALQKVTFPESITEIGQHAFRWANALERLICKAVVPPTLNTSQQNFPNKIYVPDDSVETYKSDIAWSKYADRIYPLSELDE